jgi:Fibronectin type III domain
MGCLAIALAGCGGESGTDAAGSTASTGGGSTSTTVSDTAAANTGGSSTASGSTGGTSTVTTPTTTASSTVSLSWVPPTQNSDGSPITNLAGYKIHYGTSSSDYTATVAVDNAGLTRYVIDNLKSGTYYFAITAYNAQGLESPLSGEITTSVD